MTFISSKLDLTTLPIYEFSYGTIETLQSKIPLCGRLLSEYNTKFNTHFLKLSDKYTSDINVLKQRMYEAGLITSDLAKPCNTVNVKNKTKKDNLEIIHMSKGEPMLFEGVSVSIFTDLSGKKFLNFSI